ncbi:hypothetical protein [Slackia piriformis]
MKTARGPERAAVRIAHGCDENGTPQAVAVSSCIAVKAQCYG